MSLVSLLFKTLYVLPFLAEFDISENEQQDFLLFDGNGTKAHLSRSDTTISLFLASNSEFELYEIYNISKSFTFKWEGFMINQNKMTLVNFSKRIKEISFHSYLFINPIKIYNEFCTDLTPTVSRIFHCENINYGLLTVIILAIGLGLRSDPLFIRLWKILKKNYTLPSSDFEVGNEMSDSEFTIEFETNV